MYDHALWRRYKELREQTAMVKAELTKIDQGRRREKLKGRLPPHQAKVMNRLISTGEEFCVCFATIASATGLSTVQVRRACRALRRLGFAAYERGLFNTDGEVAGSGYRVTKAGEAWWQLNDGDWVDCPD